MKVPETVSLSGSLAHTANERHYLLKHRFAPFVYSDDGKELREVLWEETLDEFSFAHARQVVNSMQAAT